MSGRRSEKHSPCDVEKGCRFYRSVEPFSECRTIVILRHENREVSTGLPFIAFSLMNATLCISRRSCGESNMQATSKYANRVRDIVREFDPAGSNRYFLFGSSVRRPDFHDIDLGVVGNSSARKPLSALRDLFYESTIPYKVDVVDFDDADEEFRSHVLGHEPIVWIH